MFFEKAGAFPICAPAVATGKGGAHSGTGLAASPNVSVFDYCEYHGQCSQERAGATISWVKRGPTDFLLIIGYLQPSIGIAKTNMQILESWALWLIMFKGPWMIVADFNVSPTELAASAWFRFIGGNIVVPEDTNITCTSGKGRIIDFLLVSDQPMPYVCNVKSHVAPWKPHLGISFEVCLPC